MAAEIIRLTAENLDREHLCCAISDKKCQEGYEAKKEYLRRRLAEGLVFKKLDVRHKVFIEYGPAESAWIPLAAPDYLVIDCLWVAGAYAGQGYGRALLEECLAEARGKAGIVVLSSDRKRPFLADKRFFLHQGFEVCDRAGPYFELLTLRLDPAAPSPRFLDKARACSLPGSRGLVAHYSARCPYTERYVARNLARAADERGLPCAIIRTDSREAALELPCPSSIFGLFRDGQFLTHEIPAPTKLAALLGPGRSS